MTPPTAPQLIAVRFDRPLRRIAAGVLVLLLAGCASRTPAPVEERLARPPKPGTAAPVAKPVPEPDWRPQTYTVKRGDTLHAIALDHGLDYRELAAWNNIENVNVIRVGQVLRLQAAGDAGGAGESAPAGQGVTTAPLRIGPPVVAGEAKPPLAPSAAPPAAPGPRNTDVYKSQPKALKEPYSEQALREIQRNATAAPPSVAVAPAPPPEPAAVVRPETKPESRAEAKPGSATDEDADKIDWLWPATGKIVTGFADSANLKGIDIAGNAGQPVVASAAGKVVYAGAGLRGYGKLVIVKHSNTFLSAYAHNRDLLVKEGQQVTRGQKIAEMGNTDSDQVKLHFEIRRLGKPVDPLKYLPPA